VGLVDLVYLVCFVHLVRLVQLYQSTKKEKITCSGRPARLSQLSCTMSPRPDLAAAGEMIGSNRELTTKRASYGMGSSPSQ
jgi:hypothetical protein